MTDDATAPAPKRSRRPLSTARKLLFSGVFACLVLGLAEGISRISEWRRASKRSARTHAHYDTGLVARDGTPISQEPGTVQLVLDPELTFRLLPGHSSTGISINADGFRGPELRKQGAAYRILLTGGSTAFGWGASADEACLAPLLEAELVRRWDRPVEVINAGIPSYRLADELALVSLRGLDYEPDLVISLTGYNDLYQAFGEATGSNQLFDQLEARLSEAYSLGPTLLMNSALGRRLLRKLGNQASAVAQADAKAVQQATEARFLRLARRLAAVCEGKLVLALQPLYALHTDSRPAEEVALLERYFTPWGERGPAFQSYTQEAVARWRTQLTAAKLPGAHVVDLSAAFEGFPQPAFDDPCHLTDAGNAELAKRLAEFVCSPGVVGSRD